MKEIPLGRQISVPVSYDPSILCAIPRGMPREGMFGFDLWRCYELSWLNPKGKPEVAVLEIIYPLASRNIVESKSLKLYLFGLSNRSFSSSLEVKEVIRRDLEDILFTPWISITIHDNETNPFSAWSPALPGINMDGRDIDVSSDGPDPMILVTQESVVHEILSSHLLRSFCPITHQPDFASVLIDYRGRRIDQSALLRYICSYRNHEGFSEECCEMIYGDIMSSCYPEELTVSCFYTRRGGIDINPVRTSLKTDAGSIERYRLFRQ